MAYLGFRTRTKSLSIYLRQLGTYFGAGVDVRTVFKSLANNARGSGLRKASAGIARDVDAGASLGDAFANWQAYFRPLVVQMVRSGEQTGTLDEVFGSLAKYYEWRLGLYRSIVSRLFYPAIGLFLAVHIVAAVTYLIPWPIFGNLKGAAILIYFYAAVLLGLMLPWLSRMLLGGTNIFHYILFYLPILGKQIKRLARARFSLAMALMSRSAISLPDAIAAAGNSTGNTVFKRGLRPAIEAIKQGEGITVSLRKTGLFDTSYLSVLETGETAGSLEQTFLRLNRMGAEDARYALERIATLATWGLYVGWMVLMVFLILRMWRTVYQNVYAPYLGG